MRALVFRGLEHIGFEEVAEPVLREPGDALVRVRRAGLCGSDLHIWHGRERGIDPGTVMGHELAGEVLAVGPAVSGLAVGDRVVAPFTTCCGECFYCRGGLPCRCRHGQLFGWMEGGRGLEGAQAEQVRVPLADSTLVRVPEGVPLELALLAGDVLATGWYGAELAGAAAGADGEAVVVIGCGPVGLAAILACREGGVRELWAVDAVPDRLALAEHFGARPLGLGDDPPGVLREATAGRGADCVVEAVGSPAAARLAFDLLRPGGTLAIIGVHNEAALPITPAEAYGKNLTLRTGRCPARRFLEPLLSGIAAGRWPVAELLSHRLPLEAGPEAYRRFAAREAGWIKVVFEA